MATKLVCKYCGSTELVKDAAARWNGEQWELSAVYDSMACDGCGQESDTLAEEIPIQITKE